MKLIAVSCPDTEDYCDDCSNWSKIQSTQSGNISIPKQWREELGIEPNSKVVIEKTGRTIIIEPLKTKSLKEAFKQVDEEIRKRRIAFSRAEAIADDLFD